MSANLNVLEAERRAQRYWSVDGLPELMMGLLWIVWGAAWLVGQGLPRGSVSNIYWTLAPLLLVFTGLAAVWATKKLKARITFPRTGYVEWKPPSRLQQIGGGGSAALIAGVLVVLLTKSRTEGWEHLAAPMIGAVIAVGLAIAAVVQRAPHLLIVAGASVVFGFALGSTVQGSDGLNWMLVALGATTSIVGGVRLWRFVRTHPFADTPA
jgi:hypothetical protein